MSSELDYQQVISTIYDKEANLIDVGTNCANATVQRIDASDSNITLLLPNMKRRASIFYNESSEICYLKFGSNASTNDYTLQIAPNSTLIINSVNYTGQIDAIWSGSDGSIQITELMQ